MSMDYNRAGFEWEVEIPAADASGAAGRAALQEAVGKGEFCAAILPDGGKLVHAIGCEPILRYLAFVLESFELM